MDELLDMGSLGGSSFQPITGRVQYVTGTAGH